MSETNGELPQPNHENDTTKSEAHYGRRPQSESAAQIGDSRRFSREQHFGPDEIDNVLDVLSRVKAEADDRSGQSEITKADLDRLLSDKDGKPFSKEVLSGVSSFVKNLREKLTRQPEKGRVDQDGIVELDTSVPGVEHVTPDELAQSSKIFLSFKNFFFNYIYLLFTIATGKIG